MTHNSNRNITSASRPARPPEPLWENFPNKLITLVQWVCWAYLWVNNRWTKVPFEPDGSYASVTDSSSWACFEHAQCGYFSVQDGEIPFDGIGFVITPADPFTVFDFDHCRNPHSGEIDPAIANYIRRLDSYTEVSPSGAGLRVVVEATLPPHHRRAGCVEMYDARRFVSITGHVL
jgi:putative DNA primase/helicase